MDKSKKLKNAELPLPSMDFKLGMELSGGDIDLAQTLLEELIKQLPDDLKRAKIAHDENNYRKLQVIIDSVLDGVIYCGVPRLQAATTDLYQCLKMNADQETTETAFISFCLAGWKLIMDHWFGFIAPKLLGQRERVWTLDQSSQNRLNK